MIIVTNWNEIHKSNISEGFKEEIQTFFKELVHDNMGENHLTYDFTEIGKIAVLESSDDLFHLPEIGFYSETMLLLDKIVISKTRSFDLAFYYNEYPNINHIYRNLIIIYFSYIMSLLKIDRKKNINLIKYGAYIWEKK